MGRECGEDGDQQRKEKREKVESSSLIASPWLDGSPSSCTLENEKGGELKPDCPHPWPLVDWHPSFHSVDPPPIDNLDNGLD